MYNHDHNFDLTGCSESIASSAPPALVSPTVTHETHSEHYHDGSQLTSSELSEAEHMNTQCDVSDTDHPLFTPESETKCDDESSHFITTDCMQPEYFNKIYTGSDISLCAANCAIMRFATSHNLTYSAIDDLLHLLNFLCPKPNTIPSTIYKLKKFFKDHEIPHVNQCFCTKCKNIHEECECEEVRSTNIGNIVSISIEKPLQAVLSGKKL